MPGNISSPAAILRIRLSRISSLTERGRYPDALSSPTVVGLAAMRAPVWAERPRRPPARRGHETGNIHSGDAVRMAGCPVTCQFDSTCRAPRAMSHSSGGEAFLSGGMLRAVSSVYKQTVRPESDDAPGGADNRTRERPRARPGCERDSPCPGEPDDLLRGHPRGGRTDP